MLGKFKGFFQGAEGSVMVLTALGLVAFLGFASLAIDMGHLYVVRNDLQNTADAAALAGAANLIRNESGVAVRDSALASQKIMEVAQRQSEILGFAPVDPGARNDLTVTFGEWNIYTGNPATAWTDMGASVPTTSTANGVRVTIRRGSGLVFGPVTTFLAGAIGHPTSEVLATATAYLGYANAGETGSVTLPLAVPETVLTAMQDAKKSWWAKLLGPSEAIATTTRSVTFKDLGSGTFYQNNLGKPQFDTQKGYLFIVSSSDSVPSTVIDNIERNYLTSGVKPVRAMSRGTRLYPISEYQWASNIKTIFNTLRQAYNAKKDGSGVWKGVYVPVYSTTNPMASRLDQGLNMLAKWFSFGPSPAHACFLFHTQTYPGGNVPIYVDGFANVDVTNVTYTSTCNPCSPYTPYTSTLDCMVNNPDSCRNANSITVQVPLDYGTVSPPGTSSGGPDNQHIYPPGGTANSGAIAAIPRLVN